MRTLYILRHASAEAARPQRADRDRPLTPAGVQEAEAMGRFMAKAGLSCDALACSSAERARQTGEALLRAAGSTLKPEAVDELYDASGEAILRWLQARPGREQRLLIVGHMPGVGELLSLLTTESAALALSMQPCTLAQVDADAKSWAECDYGRGSLQLLLPVALVKDA